MAGRLPLLRVEMEEIHRLGACLRSAEVAVAGIRTVGMADPAAGRPVAVVYSLHLMEDQVRRDRGMTDRVHGATGFISPQAVPVAVAHRKRGTRTTEATGATGGTVPVRLYPVRRYTMPAAVAVPDTRRLITEGAVASVAVGTDMVIALPVPLVPVIPAAVAVEGRLPDMSAVRASSSSATRIPIPTRFRRPVPRPIRTRAGTRYTSGRASGRGR